MSYLNSLSLVFTGDFRADVSTVNNDVRLFNNPTFDPKYQQQSQGADLLGRFNPDGGAIFEFVNCTIKRCIKADGSDDPDNPLLGMPVSNDAQRSGGKMVDLDPQMQLTSELWAVRFKLTTGDGKLLFKGKILHAGFRDLVFKQFAENLGPDPSVNGQPLGASYYTVIEEVEWGEAANEYDIVKDLRNASQDNRLRLKLSQYSFYYTDANGRFTLGSIIGSVSPWKRGEPLKFTSDRRMYGTIFPFGPIAAYLGFVNYNINTVGKKLLIDLGMSIPMIGAEGTVHPAFTSLTVAVCKDYKANMPAQKGKDAKAQSIDGSHMEEIGTVTISDPATWLAETGGIATLDVPANQLNLLKNNQLLILWPQPDGSKVVIAREQEDGLYVRADQNVHRLDPGEIKETDLYVFQYGKPLHNAQVAVSLDPQLEGQGILPTTDLPNVPVPPINVPAGVISLGHVAPTDNNGKTSITLTGGDPGNPRGYIDGQIYLHSYGVNGLTPPELNQYFLDKIIVHQRDAYEVPENPTWADVRDVWLQFGNLYPIMSKHIMDFKTQQSILSKKAILLFAFGLSIEDELYMPVSRDLSANKLATLVKWLQTASPEEAPAEDMAAAAAAESTTAEAQAGKTPVNELNVASRAKAGDRSAFDIRHEDLDDSQNNASPEN